LDAVVVSFILKFFKYKILKADIMPKEEVCTAAHLSPGQKASIVKIEGRGYLRKRLLDMGVVAGVVIQMVRRAPLGDPIAVKVKGYHLSLRRSEASYIIVKRLG